jgi:hypothetical protein
VDRFRSERAEPLSPSRRRKCIDHVRQELGVSERRACRTLGQHRSTQRKVPQGRADEERLTEDIIELADQYGRYGYRMVTGLLSNAGWCVNHKRVERIWRRERGGSGNDPGDRFPDKPEGSTKTEEKGASLDE